MPIDDLTALGQKMREARKKKDLTQHCLLYTSHHANHDHAEWKQIVGVNKRTLNKHSRPRIGVFRCKVVAQTRYPGNHHQ